MFGMTPDGAVVRRGLAYRSNEPNPVSAEDMKKLMRLGLKRDLDLRTSEGVNAAPDQVPPARLGYG